MPYTRITNRYTSESVINNLLANRAKLVDLQQQISSGKRINKFSDDVIAGISVSSTNNALSKLENYLKNIGNAQSEVETANKSLLTALDSVHTAKELVVQGLNATSGTEELNMMSAQIKQIIQQVRDLGNTKYGDKFIFGGLKTEPTPFVSPANGEVRYTGSVYGSHERNVEINDGVVVAVNLSGDRIFGEYYTGDHDNDILTPDTLDGQGLLKTLGIIADQMASLTPDKDIIRQNMDQLDINLQTLLNAQSEIGGLSSRLEMTKASLEEDKINLTGIKSGAEDIDMAKTISDLQFQQTALQVSLQVSSQIIQPSLLNYI